MAEENDLQGLLAALEAELQEQCLWTSEPPSAEAMASTVPFAADAMEFSEWLQWIFLPTLQMLLDNNMPLPSGSDVASMGEIWCEMSAREPGQLVLLLKEIDIRLQ